jgi:hypothetical protein
MSSRFMTGRRIVALALVFAAPLAACGQTSKKGAPVSSGGAGGPPGLAGAGGQGAGSGGAPSVTPPDGAAGAGDAGGAASGGAGVGGRDGVGGAGGAAKVAEPYFRAGTRLKPRVFQMGNLKVLDSTGEQGWFDKETGVACWFTIGADGIERCLPSQTEGLSYSDARCRSPVLIGPTLGPDQTPVPYVTVATAASCTQHVYRLRASSVGGSPVYYVNEKGSCAKLADRVNSDQVVFPLEEVPLDTFVTVKRVSRPRAPHMDALVREGDDGSYEVVGFVDPVRKQPCFALGMDVSPALCVPGWQGTDDTFDGPDCTKPVAFDESGTRCPTRPNATLLKVDWLDGVCRDRSIAAVWEIASSVRTAIYVKENGVCALNGGSADPIDVLVAGAPIALASLPKLEMIDVGDGPLKVRFYGFDGVPFLPAPRSFAYRGTTGPFLDAATGEWCEPSPFVDDQWRCVPSSFERVVDFHVQFASGDCTGARVLEPKPTPTCSEQAPEPRGMVVETLVKQVDGYNRIAAALGVTGTVSPASVSMMGSSATSCAAFLGNGRSYYELNKALNPADVFVPLERKRDD